MPRRKQLTGLKKLISMPPKDMKREVPKFIYEDTATVLKLLFQLMHTEKFYPRKKDNILSLMKYFLSRFSLKPLPLWIIFELNKILASDDLSDLDKALIFSAFEPEDLLNKLEGFKNFVENFSEIKESFKSFIVEQIHLNPSFLYDIHKAIIEQGRSEEVLAMIDDLEGSEEPEPLLFLEHLTYHHDSNVSLSALKAIKKASNQNAINTLYSIACLNPLLKDEAERSYISLMHKIPLNAEDLCLRPAMPFVNKKKYVELRVSLIDSNGAMSAFIGKQHRRNNYFFATVLMKFGVGIKDVIIVPSLTKEEYQSIKREYFSELSCYSIEEVYLKKLIGHFLKLGLSEGFSVPIELVILKIFSSHLISILL